MTEGRSVRADGEARDSHHGEDDAEDEGMLGDETAEQERKGLEVGVNEKGADIGDKLDMPAWQTV